VVGLRVLLSDLIHVLAGFLTSVFSFHVPVLGVMVFLIYVVYQLVELGSYLESPSETLGDFREFCVGLVVGGLMYLCKLGL
jgi:hypothetical protein